MREVTSASRRRILQTAVAVAGATLVRAGVAQNAAAPRVIELTARRFTYIPNEIALKVGERVVIEISSIDFVHGMNLPGLQRRSLQDQSPSLPRARTSQRRRRSPLVHCVIELAPAECAVTGRRTST